MFKEYRLLCKKCKVDFNKELIIGGVIVLVLIGLAIYLSINNSVTLGLACISLILLYYVYRISMLNDKAKQITAAKEIAFNSFYRYLISYLSNGNILYSSLQSTLEFVDPILKDDVEVLISDIELDTSLQPFLNFQENFDDDNIRQMILLLFKTQENGNIENVLDSINECMMNLQDTSIEIYVTSEKRKIEKYYIFPIILSAIVIIMLSLFIFNSIGDGIYV